MDTDKPSIGELLQYDGAVKAARIQAQAAIEAASLQADATWHSAILTFVGLLLAAIITYIAARVQAAPQRDAAQLRAEEVRIALWREVQKLLPAIVVIAQVAKEQHAAWQRDKGSQVIRLVVSPDVPPRLRAGGTDFDHLIGPKALMVRALAVEAIEDLHNFTKWANESTRRSDDFSNEIDPDNYEEQEDGSVEYQPERILKTFERLSNVAASALNALNRELMKPVKKPGIFRTRTVSGFTP